MSKYVLVVDDNPSDLMLTSAYVEKEGYVVIQARDGHEGLDKLFDVRYCLFLVDLQMPGMSGIELIKRIKRVEKYKDVPVLVTSARKETKDVKLAVQAGASDYLVKPIDALVFEEKLNRIMGRKAEWKEYDISPDSELSKGFVKDPLRILSVSEVGLTVLTGKSLEIGSTVEIGSHLIGGPVVMNVKVDECEPIEKGYRSKLSFVATREETRKKLRLLCRELWSQSRGELDLHNKEAQA